jgi:flagellar hook-associated protein 2
MTIRAAGVGSGLDLEALVTKLMEAERQPLRALQRTQEGIRAKISAWGSVKGALASLESAAEKLRKPSTFAAMSAASSDNAVLTASAGESATAGEYVVEVVTLARSHVLRSNGEYTAPNDSFTTGTISIQVGDGSPVEVTIDGSNNTLAGIRDAIAAAGAGVRASLVHDGTRLRLLLASATEGAAGTIRVSVVDSGSGGSFALAGFDSASLVQVQAAQDAELRIEGLAITRPSNTVSDALEGLTLKLAAPGSATLRVRRDDAAASGAVAAFVKAYNDVVNSLRQLTAYDSQTRKAGLLAGDSVVRGVQTRLGSLIASEAGSDPSVRRLSDVGVTLQKDGTLALDASKLAAALEAGHDVAGFFASTSPGAEGIAVRFAQALREVLGGGGPLTGRTEALAADIRSLEKRQEAMQSRLAEIERRYREQFVALDAMLARMTATSTFLAQQLANLPLATGAGRMR